MRIPGPSAAQKLGWFDVRDYGAAGNGTTDDSAAFQAAATAAMVLGGVFFVPAGTFLVKSQVQFNGTLSSGNQTVYIRGNGSSSRIIVQQTVLADPLFLIREIPSAQIEGITFIGGTTGTPNSNDCARLLYFYDVYVAELKLCNFLRLHATLDMINFESSGGRVRDCFFASSGGGDSNAYATIKFNDYRGTCLVEDSYIIDVGGGSTGYPDVSKGEYFNFVLVGDAAGGYPAAGSTMGSGVRVARCGVDEGCKEHAVKVLPSAANKAPLSVDVDNLNHFVRASTGGGVYVKWAQDVTLKGLSFGPFTNPTHQDRDVVVLESVTKTHVKGSNFFGFDHSNITADASCGTLLVEDCTGQTIASSAASTIVDSAGIRGASSGGALTVSSNTIAPTQQIHSVGAGLIKTITVPYTGFQGPIVLIPTAAFTYDNTGNITPPTGGTNTAIVGQPMIATYYGTKWYMSY